MPNRIEEGRKYTDSVYATKEEIRSLYNNQDIESVWENILSYRQYFDTETELVDSEGSHYKVCLTKKMTGIAYDLQLRIMAQANRYVLLNDDQQALLGYEELAKALRATANFANINISANTLERFIHNEIENMSTQFFPLKTYMKAYGYAISQDKFSIETIENINRVLSGFENDEEVIYRTDTRPDVINPLVAPNISQIKDHMNRLSLFLEQQEIPLIVKALSMIYFFSYARPFEYANEETAGLAVKCLLKCKGLDLPGFSLPFESLSYTTSQSYFRKQKSTEETLDLTYFVDTTLDFLSHCSDIFENELYAHEKKTSESEVEGENINPKTFSSESVTFALPVFPVSGNSTEVGAIASKLMLIYPQLKKKQAHFYAGHCQVGLNYTIEQFRKEEKTVYETARTSMEDLANRGFYEKKQIGKKFVYTPVPLKDAE